MTTSDGKTSSIKQVALARYDFRALSDYEFETLCRDLLTNELSLRLEIFAPGRDEGIDLRHLAPDDGAQTVVQCKHYVGSTFSNLKSQLSKELPKIRKIAPQRYCLAISLPLTPHRKGELVSLLSPYVQGPQDIWGQDDLNALLREQPHVERSHFKLWLTSTEVLSAVLNQDILGRSGDFLLDIERKATLYVPNESFPEAKRRLDKYGVCIISGEPGVGKTMLAEMLVLDYASRDFEPVIVSEDIADAERVYRLSSPQIFYYDDFLGQASTAEKLGKNEESRLVNFARRVARSNNKKFILTTREYILQQARLDYEKLFHADIELYKYVLDLATYSRFQRAVILYNHLYFGKVDRPQLESILSQRCYLKIIDHPNYSPRLVEHIVRLFKTSDD